ncbi:hypothetical protein ACHAP8_006195 [Fusarium lateritium]
MSSTLDREHSTDESLFGSSPSPSPPSREPSTDESLFGSPPSSPSLPVEPSIVESAASGSPEPQSPILSDGTPDEMLESFCSVEESVVWDLANDKSHEMDFGVENWAPNQEAQDTFKQQAEIVNAVYARIPKPEKGRDLKKLTDDILLEAYETNSKEEAEDLWPTKRRPSKRRKGPRPAVYYGKAGKKGQEEAGGGREVGGYGYE